MSSWQSRLEHALGPADAPASDLPQPDAWFTRRRVVVAITLVIGAALLGVSLGIRPGDRNFYPLTAALAMTWLLGSIASGPLHLGPTVRGGSPYRPVWTPVLVGLAAAATFIVGALIVREIAPLRDYTDDVLAHARHGALALILLLAVLNGIAEEAFFRGALFDAIGQRHPVATSTAIYAAAALASGNPMLAFGAATLGIVLGMQRRASGGLLAPMLTHVTWSIVLLLALPPLFAAAPGGG